MNASKDQRPIDLKDITVSHDFKLDQVFGGRVLFVEKNEIAAEYIRKHKLPTQLLKGKLSK